MLRSADRGRCCAACAASRGSMAAVVGLLMKAVIALVATAVQVAHRADLPSVVAVGKDAAMARVQGNTRCLRAAAELSRCARASRGHRWSPSSSRDWRSWRVGKPGASRSVASVMLAGLRRGAWRSTFCEGAASLDCGCFQGARQPLEWRLVVRNVVLALAAFASERLLDWPSADPQRWIHALPAGVALVRHLHRTERRVGTRHLTRCGFQEELNHDVLS